MIRVLRETHIAAAGVARRLARAGGLNRFGEPNFRAVWGWSRLAWIGGKFEDRDASGALVRETVALRLEPKYAPLDRWHIERWCPPEMYGSPEDWRAATLEVHDGRSVAALGPYPSRGEYEHVFTVEDARGEFVQLTPAIAEYLSRMIEASRSVAPQSKRASLDRRESRNDARYDAWAEAVLGEATPAFHGAPCVAVA
jgi:hypothetical protein